LQYLLFFEGDAETAKRMLAMIILRTPRPYRNKLHNWGAISQHMDAGELSMHGADISQLDYPLFPPLTCRITNSKVFAANTQVFMGGAAATNPVRRLYHVEEAEPQQGAEFKGGSRGAKTEDPPAASMEKRMAGLEKQLAQFLARSPAPQSQGQKPKGVWGGGAQSDSAPKNA